MTSKRIVWLPLWLMMVGLVFSGPLTAPVAGDDFPVVRITSPVYDSNHAKGDPIHFTCAVKNRAGADVKDATLVWLSNLDGRIGTGYSVSTNRLSMGIHRITVNASDAGGGILGSDTIKIKVRYVNKNEGTDQSGVVGIGETGGEGYVVNPMY